MGAGRRESRNSTAVRAAVVDKCLLDGVQLIALSDAFDGGDVGTVNLRHRDETTVHNLSVEFDCARATLTFAAAFLCAGEVQLLSQHVEQPRHRKDFELM